MGSTSMEERFKSMDDALKDYNEAIKAAETGTAKPKIGRVPFVLQEHKEFKEKYFEPRGVSIGPIHHGTKEKFKQAEELKLYLAALFIEKSDHKKESLFQVIRDKIEELKWCYVEEIRERYKDDYDKLAWILFVDGCALLHFIHHFDNPGMLNNLNIKMDLAAFAHQDVFLLENQLPYLVLELLIVHQKHDSRKDQLQNSILKFIGSNMLMGTTQLDKKIMTNSKPIHLLDLLRTALLLSGLCSQQQEKSESTVNIYTPPKVQCNQRPASHTSLTDKVSKAYKTMVNICRRTSSEKTQPNYQPTFRNIKELKEAGIYVHRKETSCLKDIRFTAHKLYGALELPPIKVDDSTAPIFLNLAAYEMCPDHKNDFGICSYICFMDSLIDHPEDVKELRNKNILHNVLGSDEEVADLFNKISTDLVPNPEIYSDVNKKIQLRFDDKVKTKTAQFHHQHFSTPWSKIATIAAAAGLLFSFLQTLYTMKEKPAPTPIILFR